MCYCCLQQQQHRRKTFMYSRSGGVVGTWRRQRPRRRPPRWRKDSTIHREKWAELGWSGPNTTIQHRATTVRYTDFSHSFSAHHPQRCSISRPTPPTPSDRPHGTVYHCRKATRKSNRIILVQHYCITKSAERTDDRCGEMYFCKFTPMLKLFYPPSGCCSAPNTPTLAKSTPSSIVWSVAVTVLWCTTTLAQTTNTKNSRLEWRILPRHDFSSYSPWQSSSRRRTSA